MSCPVLPRCRGLGMSYMKQASERASERAINHAHGTDGCWHLPACLPWVEISILILFLGRRVLSWMAGWFLCCCCLWGFYTWGMEKEVKQSPR